MNNALAINNQDNDGMSMGLYSSINAGNQDERLAIYDAVSNAEPMGDMVGKVIMAENIVIQPVTIEDMNTHEPVDTVRVVVIDPDGKAYASIGSGIQTSIRNLMGIVGEPPYDPAIPLRVEDVKTRNGYHTHTFVWARDYKPKASK